MDFHVNNSNVCMWSLFNVNFKCIAQFCNLSHLKQLRNCLFKKKEDQTNYIQCVYLLTMVIGPSDETFVA